MTRNTSPNPIFDAIDVRSMAEAICSLQKPNGEIPWSADGKTDPWDHVESAMGLAVAGYLKEARDAFAWIAFTQNPDGSFFDSYKNGQPLEERKDPNMSTYVALGVYHYYLISGDKDYLEKMWPTIEKAINFAVSLQAPEGPIYWSQDMDGNIEKRCLLTGSSSIYMSIQCALAIAKCLNKSRPQWEFARRKLGKAISTRPDLFDESKSRYSMDWYYPILCGAVTGKDAQDRISTYWDEFVVDHWGVRCVSDRPWVTMAESSECVLALAGIEMFEEAETIFRWVKDSCFENGLYWTGVTVPDSVVWPEEQTTWTTAAVLLAADALYTWTPGSHIFSHEYWKTHRSHAKSNAGKREKSPAL